VAGWSKSKRVGRLWRITVAVAALLLLTGIAALLVVPDSASAANYSYFVSCELPPEPSHECVAPDELVAINVIGFFEADKDTNYELCIEYPDEYFPCVGPFLAEAKVPQENGFAALEVGRYEAVWYFAGTDEEIGSWEFKMVEPPPSSAPAASPVVPAVVLPSKMDANCQRAKKRVRKLKGQIRRASSSRQKAKLRGKLKRARAKVKRVC
jgi:hypothetical protein